MQYKVNPAVCLDKPYHARDHNGNHGDVVHAHHTALAVGPFCDDRENFSRGNHSGGHADYDGEHRADHKHQENVHSGQRAHQHHKIRQNLKHVVAQISGDVIFSVRQDKKQDEGDDSGRKDNADIFPELVFHLAALCAGGGDGCVGDHGEVVPEHRAAHHGSHAKCARDSRFLTDSRGNGSQSHDGSHRCSHRRGDKAPDQEQARDGNLRRKDRQAEINGAVHAARCLNRAGKGAGQNEHQAHDHDVFVSHAPRDAGKLFRKGALGILQESGHQRDEKAHDGGHGVKISEQDTASDEDHKKNGNGQKSPGVSFLHPTIPPFQTCFL